MPDGDDRTIADMENAEMRRAEENHLRAEYHQVAVEAFIREHGVEALELALASGLLFRRLRQESRWALETAISASAIRGVDGYLVIHLPRLPSDLAEMSYVTGGAQITLGFG